MLHPADLVSLGFDFNPTIIPCYGSKSNENVLLATSFCRYLCCISILSFSLIISAHIRHEWLSSSVEAAKFATAEKFCPLKSWDDFTNFVDIANKSFCLNRKQLLGKKLIRMLFQTCARRNWWRSRAFVKNHPVKRKEQLKENQKASTFASTAAIQMRIHTRLLTCVEVQWQLAKRAEGLKQTDVLCSVGVRWREPTHVGWKWQTIRESDELI